MSHNVDLVKLSTYVKQARHCLDKAEHLVQQSLIKQDSEKIDRKVENDNTNHNKEE